MQALEAKMTFAVLGVGAVGGLYGGLLAKAGCQVHFLARSDYQHLKQHGLRVESVWKNFDLPSVSVYHEARAMPVVDCVLVAWKTTSNHELSQVLPHLCGPETMVLVLQNGLDVERSAAQVVGGENVLGGCCFLCSNKIGPGHVRHLDYGRIAYGEYDSRLRGQITNRMQKIKQDFSAAGIDVQPAEDLWEVRWKKLAWNIPFNGLSVVLSADTSALMNYGPASQLAEELMIEVAQCAAACGVAVPESHVQQMLTYTRNMVPYASSMLLDYQARRPLELEAIFGNPIRFAVAAGYQPKRIQMLHSQLQFIDWRNRADQPG